MADLSFGSNGASCVEVLEADGATYLRDTKSHGEGAVLHLDGPAWSAFLREVAHDARSANGAVEVTADDDGGRLVRDDVLGRRAALPRRRVDGLPARGARRRVRRRRGPTRP